jgi:4-hydroxy-tetrahydrodipicolinate synthase
VPAGGAGIHIHLSAHLHFHKDWLDTMKLEGCYTALVTPFAKGKVAYATLRDLVERQVAAGVAGLVPVGTTGESPTLTVSEHKKVIELVVAAAAGRCQVIAGTGANSTAEALELTRHAKAVGADATLQVTPYYNKPTQEGLYRHFAAVADWVGLPVVLYSIPGRCVVPINTETVVRLAKHSNIVAVKEAGGSVDRVSELLSACDLTVLSGDDPLTLPMMVLGARGVISVASNLLPQDVNKLTRLALAGKWEPARQQHYRLYDFFRKIFIETNPIPIKAAMAMAGLIEEEYRLPLCPMAAGNRAVLAQCLRDLGVAVRG